MKITAIQFMTVLDTQTDYERIADDSISAIKIRRITTVLHGFWSEFFPKSGVQVEEYSILREREYFFAEIDEMQSPQQIGAV